jgi:predicted nucleic acid-binding protein
VRSAVDTSVLLDVFSRSSLFLAPSRQALRIAVAEGSLIACDIVWAETRAHFPSQSAFEEAMSALGVEFESCDARAASLAGEAWKRYRQVGGPRATLVPDFLVAAHALVGADRLLTRDRGFTRRYFRNLKILDPTTLAG